MDFSGKKVLIVGLGKLGGGVGNVKFFVRQGAKVTVSDLKSEKELSSSIAELSNLNVGFILGKHRKEDFINTDLIIKNPAVPSSLSYLEEARQKNIPIETAESLFLKLSPTNEIIGVTGTRGKSTTSNLIYQIFRDAGFDIYLAGNVAFTSTLSILSKLKSNSKVVLELSSFQLESFGWSKISPHMAIITNIYPDHLNRYQSMDDYIKDKENIFKFQKTTDYLILNGENEITEKLSKKSKAQVIFFKKDDFPSSWKLHLSGEHNLSNAACALKVARIYGIDDVISRKAFSNIKTLPYRQEGMGDFNGRQIINDSASTTPVSLITAIKRFKNKNIVLICGGNSKNLPLDALIEILPVCKAIIFLKGTGSEELLMRLKEKNLKLLGPYASLKEVITKAFAESKKGDIILFSPGFTSFATFDNEFDRGNRFKYEIETFFKKELKK